MSIICLDFDGVLHNPADRSPGYKMGKPVEGSKEVTELMLRHGHEVLIHSARVNKPEDVDHVLAWLYYFGFQVMPVYIHKPLADIYIDDKGLHFTGWDTALPELAQRLGWADATAASLVIPQAG